MSFKTRKAKRLHRMNSKRRKYRNELIGGLIRTAGKKRQRGQRADAAAAQGAPGEQGHVD